MLERLFRRLAHRYAHGGSQIVNWSQSALALDMPEGPPVAGGQPLHQRADLVDRSDSRASGERAIGSHQSAMAPRRVDQSFAWARKASFDDA